MLLLEEVQLTVLPIIADIHQQLLTTVTLLTQVELTIYVLLPVITIPLEVVKKMIYLQMLLIPQLQEELQI